MDLVIKQTVNQQENGNSALLDLLYNLTKPDPITGQAVVNNATLVGRISVPSAYEDAVNFLNTRFSVEQDNGSDFQVTVLNNNYYIRFADSAVESVIKTALNKAESEGITTQEAGNTNLGTIIFKNNTNIETFEEMHYFLYTGGDFEGCSNLHTVDVGNKNISQLSFRNCANLEKINGSAAEPGVIRIPYGTTSIGGYMFAGCPKISVVYLPDTLTSLGYRCFNTAGSFPGTYLTEIHFGTGISRIDPSVFQTPQNLTEVYIKDLEMWIACDIQGSISGNHHLYLENDGNPVEITSLDLTGKTAISKYVFYGCSYITSVVLDTALTSIGSCAFGNCTSLVIPNLDLPNLTTLGSYAFKGTKVQTISDLGSVTSIPEYCFQNCSSLSSVVIPSTVATIGNNAFDGCTNLVITDLNLPNLVSLGSYAFKGTKVQTISDLGNITNIPSYCFNTCQSLTNVIIPNSVTSIDQRAFRECSSLASITIGNGVTTIGEYVFGNCSSLVSVTIPNSVTAIGNSTFMGCRNLIYFHGTGSIAGELNLSNVISIGNETFNNCNGLTSVTIGNNATSIGYSAFFSCKGLISVNIGNSMASIGNMAFNNCSSLTSVTINAVTPPTLGISVFNGTSNCSIYVPAGSVEAYKTADGWKEIPNADTRIKAIQG